MSQLTEGVRPVKNMSDVKDVFDLPLRNDPTTAAEVYEFVSKDDVYEAIKHTPRKFSDGHSLRLRVNGIVKVLSAVLEVVCKIQLVPEEQCDLGPAMIWGSLGFALKQFPVATTSDRKKPSSCLPYLGFLENLTTELTLPSPPTCWDGNNDPHLSAVLLQLLAELACGILYVGLFLQKNLTHKDRTTGDKYDDFRIEHRKTVSRIGCLANKFEGYRQVSNNHPAISHKLSEQSSEKIPVFISKEFQGREKYLEEMHQALLQAQEEPAVLSVHGLPGIGKTQLAARYCKEFKMEYKSTLWIDADESMKIKEGLSRYAIRLGLPKADSHGDTAANAEIVISWLQSCKHPWIIVFDNVDNVTILKEYWPSGGKGHIIITQRNPYNAKFRTSASMEVRPLDLQDSMALFYKIIGQEKKAQHTADIEALFEEWEGVPLALNQIGNFVHRKKMDLQRFLNLYKKNTPRIYGTKNEYDEYPYSIVTAFAVQELDDRAKALLYAMCFLDPDNVPSELLLSNFDDDEPFNTIESEFDYLDAVETLCKRALLVQVQENLSVHRLVQSVALNSMSNDERDRAFEAVLSVLLRRFPREDHGKPMWYDRERCGSYLPHVFFLCKRYSNLFKNRKSLKLAELLSISTWYMFERGLFSEAEPLLNLARDALPESTENLTVATLSFNLAGIRNECNRIAEARELCECTMKIREKMLAHDDPLLGNTYYSMGIVYMEDGQLEKALEYIKRAVKIHENCPEHDHSPTAFSYGNLGLCYLRMGKLNEASICMEKSEVLWRNSCGVDSDRYATIMYYMGNLRLAQNNIEQARKLHKKAFDILCIVSPDHIKTGLSYHKIASFYLRDREFKKATQFLKQAIAIFQKNFDPTPRVARSLYKMSEVYQAAGKTTKAEQKRRQAEEMRKGITTIPYHLGPLEIAFEKLVPSFLA